MKIIYYILNIIFIVILLSSCGTHNAITIANNNVYYDDEAIIANDVYTELYNNKVINEKPITIKKKER